MTGLRCYINGIEYEMRVDKFNIVDALGNKASSTISVKVNSQPIPRAGDIVILTLNLKMLWTGIAGIPKSPKFTHLGTPRIYDIVCSNMNAIASRRIVNFAEHGKTVSYLVQKLFNDYLAAEPFITLGYISDVDLIVDVYTAQDKNLKDALDELAASVQATWTITSDLKFYFLVQTDFQPFPFVIDKKHLIGADLQSTTKDYDMRTVQIITGMSDYTSIQTETFTYENGQSSFDVVFPIALQPIIYINDVAVNSQYIGVNGINNDDPSIKFFWSYNSKTVTIQSAAGLVAGDVIRIEYQGFFNVRIVQSNDERIAEIAQSTGTSGIIEAVEIAKDIRSMTDGVALANSLLTRFERARGDLSFWLRSADLAAYGLTLDDVMPGVKITFDLPEIGISGDYVIKERIIEPLIRDQTAADLTDKLKITLKLADRDYLQSYGQIYRDIKRGLYNLSFRADEVVIDARAIKDRQSENETMEASLAVAYFACDSISEGSIFAPLDLGNPVYPV